MSLLDDLGFRPARIGIAIILILLGVTAYTTWRNARIDALAHSALDKKGDVSTVKRLAAYSGQRSAELLWRSRREHKISRFAWPPCRR